VTQVDVRQKILADNAAAAAALRGRFADSRTLVMNLISSPGSGKTTLLEATVRTLAGKLRLGAIEGDIATERDADRLRRLGIPAHQILTGGGCHLDARQVRGALDAHDLGPLDVLFIENVGNLVCPTAYDLGEDFKVALLSVTEGEDKPFKYPGIFAAAEVTLVTKADLMPYVPFQLAEVRGQVAALRPGGTLLVTSATTGLGLAEWCALIEARLARKRAQGA
jgi:hydrogenase nickel incorporation protein HypB